jgi:hypothetical protein
MFTTKEKMLLIIGTIFFIFATFSTYYFFKSLDEKLYTKLSKEEIEF